MNPLSNAENQIEGQFWIEEQKKENSQALRIISSQICTNYTEVIE